MREITYAKAVGEGIAEEMRRDPNVFVLGEDVGKTGNIFKILAEVYQEFGAERVMDTPLSEEIITDAAVGAAMLGCRPVLEIMYSDFITLGMDGIINQAAKSLYNSSGKIKVPLVLRSNIGASAGKGSQHTQSFESIFAHVPGLKVVLPSDPYEAKGLIKSAIRDDGPVIYLEHKELYFVKGKIPEGEYTIALGKAEIKREGGDVTIVSYSRMVRESMKAAELLHEQGIEAEVIDLRCLVPLDKETVLESVQKTNRAVVVSEECRSYGAAAEIAAMIHEEAFDYLDYAVQRVTSLDTNIPFTPALVDFVIPTAAKIVDTVTALLEQSTLQPHMKRSSHQGVEPRRKE